MWRGAIDADAATLHRPCRHADRRIRLKRPSARSGGSGRTTRPRGQRPRPCTWPSGDGQRGGRGPGWGHRGRRDRMARVPRRAVGSLADTGAPHIIVDGRRLLDAPALQAAGL